MDLCSTLYITKLYIGQSFSGSDHYVLVHATARRSLRSVSAGCSVRLTSDAGYKFRNRLDVLERCSKIYDTCAQRKFSIDNRVGQKRLSATFDARENVPVQAI